MAQSVGLAATEGMLEHMSLDDQQHGVCDGVCALACHASTSADVDDVRARTLRTLTVAVRAARPAWTAEAVESFAARVESQAFQEAAGRLQYERVLAEKIARLRRVAIEDPIASVPSPPITYSAVRRPSFSAPAPPAPRRSRRESIQACVDALGHACQCSVATGCSEPSCGKVQAILHHSVSCGIAPPHCEICRQLAILCRFHAVACTDSYGCCPVPRCAMMKAELREPMAL